MSIIYHIATASDWEQAPVSALARDQGEDHHGQGSQPAP
jgi:hypothetical protein